MEKSEPLPAQPVLWVTQGDRRLPLWGDGVHDDTEVLQAVFNNPAAWQFLPPGRYLVSSPIGTATASARREHAAWHAPAGRQHSSPAEALPADQEALRAEALPALHLPNVEGPGLADVRAWAEASLRRRGLI